MEAFELPEIFPLSTSPEEHELGFQVMSISLSGFGPSDLDTLIRVVARRLSDSDVSLKMLFNGQTKYRLMRYGYAKRLGLRLPGTKPKWHPLTEELSQRPDIDAGGIESKIQPVSFER